jgi:hypothetical protein
MSPGARWPALAAEYQVKRESISKLLRKARVDLRQRRQMSQEQIDVSVRLYESGLSLEPIGSQLGWDHNTIYRHPKKRGGQLRGPNDWQR